MTRNYKSRSQMQRDGAGIENHFGMKSSYFGNGEKTDGNRKDKESDTSLDNKRWLNNKSDNRYSSKELGDRSRMILVRDPQAVRFLQ